MDWLYWDSESKWTGFARAERLNDWLYCTERVNELVIWEQMNKWTNILGEKAYSDWLYLEGGGENKLIILGQRGRIEWLGLGWLCWDLIVSRVLVCLRREGDLWVTCSARPLVCCSQYRRLLWDVFLSVILILFLLMSCELKWVWGFLYSRTGDHCVTELVKIAWVSPTSVEPRRTGRLQEPKKVSLSFQRRDLPAD